VQNAGNQVERALDLSLAWLCTSLSTKLSTASVDVIKFSLENQNLANILVQTCEMAFFAEPRSRAMVAEKSGNR
jgi:hypothetical protein